MVICQSLVGYTFFCWKFPAGRGLPDFQDKVSAENQTQMLGWQPTQGPSCPGPGAGYLRRYLCSQKQLAWFQIWKKNIPEIRRARAISYELEWPCITPTNGLIIGNWGCNTYEWSDKCI